MPLEIELSLVGTPPTFKQFGVASFVGGKSCSDGRTGWFLPIRYKSFIEGEKTSSYSKFMVFLIWFEKSIFEVDIQISVGLKISSSRQHQLENLSYILISNQ